MVGRWFVMQAWLLLREGLIDPLGDALFFVQGDGRLGPVENAAAVTDRGHATLKVLARGDAGTTQSAARACGRLPTATASMIPTRSNSRWLTVIAPFLQPLPCDNGTSWLWRTGTLLFWANVWAPTFAVLPCTVCYAPSP